MADKTLVIEKQELKPKAWALYKKGYTYREIGKLIGRSRTIVGEYINEELTRLTKEYQDIAADYVRSEIESLEDLEKVLNARIEEDSTDDGAISQLIKIKERKAKYMALDQPTKVEHSGSIVLEDLVHGEKEEKG
jgi:predicted transcriptional regulator